MPRVSQRREKLMQQKASQQWRLDMTRSFRYKRQKFDARFKSVVYKKHGIFLNSKELRSIKNFIYLNTEKRLCIDNEYRVVASVNVRDQDLIVFGQLVSPIGDSRRTEVLLFTTLDEKDYLVTILKHFK